MFSQYFGHYLLNHGLLSSEQLEHALEKQKSIHLKLGVIAVDEGFLTSAQVEEIHEKQKRQDKRFGEIGVELGYLTEEQVEKLLSVQKSSHLLLAQAIIDENYMTIDSFAHALNEYKQLHSLSDEKFEAIKNGNIEALVENLLNLADIEKREYAHYISLFIKNMIRFIDERAYVEVSEFNQEIKADWIVSQEIKGEESFFTALAFDESVLIKIASIYAEEELLEADELAQASASEFLNLHNGIFLVNMSNKGVELGMEPQIIEENAALSAPQETSLLLNVYTSEGSFKLLISMHPKQIQLSKCSEIAQAL